MLTPTSGQVFSSMCQYGVGNKNNGNLFVSILHAFYKQKVLMALQHA
jgi:hypothetical protein